MGPPAVWIARLPKGHGKEIVTPLVTFLFFWDSAMMRAKTAVIGGLFWVSILAGMQTCAGEEASIYKIEEVWELVILEPDPANHSPQVTFFTSPSVNIDDSYFQLQMNYAADVDYSPGGFHVAAVHQGRGIVDEARSETRRTLTTDGDHIRWTNVMAVIQNKLMFAVKDGHGSEWGSFGGPEYLVKIVNSPVNDLNEYHPQQSLDSVDIGFGANRVSSITLVEVRCFYSDGRVVTVPVNQQP
jgi:hypothetical protein